MPFQPGKSGNQAGRPKGSGASKEVKEAIEKLLSDQAQINKLREELTKLTGKDYVNAWSSLMPYVVPKLQSTSLDIDLERLTDDQLDELYNRILNNAK